MITAILLLALMQPQDPGLGTAAAPNPSAPAVRTEKLTPAEVKALADANQAVTDAQDKLIHAKAALQGTTEGIEPVSYTHLDVYKRQVNDNLGHKIGDDLLCSVAARFAGCLLYTSIVARWKVSGPLPSSQR